MILHKYPLFPISGMEDCNRKSLTGKQSTLSIETGFKYQRLCIRHIAKLLVFLKQPLHYALHILLVQITSRHLEDKGNCTEPNSFPCYWIWSIINYSMPPPGSHLIWIVVLHCQYQHSQYLKAGLPYEQSLHVSSHFFQKLLLFPVKLYNSNSWPSFYCVISKNKKNKLSFQEEGSSI